jgi:hypothetical protein
MAFSYLFYNNDKEKLLIYFNSLAATGLGDNFLLKHTLSENFSDYDILIVKDSEPNNWYLSVIPEIEKFITKLSCEKNHKHIFALADSSGAIPLLSILPNISLFRRAVVVNGQVDLSEDVVYKFKDNIVGHFEIEKVKGDIYKKYIKPVELIDYSNKFEILFCYNYFRSDKVYADIISNLSKPNFRLRLDFKKYTTIPCHACYIIDLFTSKNFLEEIKFYFSQYEC